MYDPDLGVAYRRNSCCLYYRTPRGTLCGDCVLHGGTGAAGAEGRPRAVRRARPVRATAERITYGRPAAPVRTTLPPLVPHPETPRREPVVPAGAGAVTRSGPLAWRPVRTRAPRLRPHRP
ncbi:(2Fe-2S)-binding protein [Streptomyces sp. SA3_actF]|uniref:(2Fe-2S)-binding protein n=1 Tax=Streptomyces sp. SA3_actF TaxID=682181 RepID=UPI001F15E923|nr:(2Fe-2S)-binding protein [Streptomyces sp. SA3_actF]